MGNHHSHDAALKEFSIDTSQTVAHNDSWDLYNGQHHATPVSVFLAKNHADSLHTLAQVFRTAWNNPRAVVMLFLLQNLKRLRHPDILRFINWTQTSSDNGGQLVTERVVPLTKVLEQQSKYQVCLGLQKITKALDFLQTIAKVSLGNVTLSSIFVTPYGHWKLAPLSQPK